MPARSTFIHLAGKAGILFGALFLVSVLLAAIPGHHAPTAPAQDSSATSQSQESQSMDHSKMSGMDMDDAKANEAHAVHDMTPGHLEAHNLHMHMTTMRPQTPEDAARANEILTQLRSGIEKYKDYKVALADGFRPFLPNLPQPMYHFNSTQNGFLESFTFEASRPTSLLYKKTATGYELIGAMYTMPVRATEEELNERIPLSVAQWHLHTNLCMPKQGQAQHADFTKFGLMGSITTKSACDANGGRFYPILFGWMVHVYPFESSREKIWEQ